MNNNAGVNASRYFTAEEIERSRTYQRPLQRARFLTTVLNLAVVLAFVWTGIAEDIVDLAAGRGWVLQLVLVISALVVASWLVSLPVAIWKTFGHEKRWGFTTTTPKRFAADQVKETVVLGIVLTSLLFVPVWAFIRSTSLWWVWGSLAVVALVAVLNVVYPVVLLPLFNKLTPLEDEELAARIQTLIDRAGLRISGIFVMDASKRSSKDNAFFAGMGATRKIVIFDTMLTLPHEQIEAVIAHEIGHWKLGHLRTRVAVGLVRFPIVFGLIAAVTAWDPARRWSGIDRLGDPASFPYFALVAGVAITVTGIGTAWLSRRDERAADRFALEMLGEPAAFSAVMRAMATRNLPDLDPMWWARITASHPNVVERLAFADAWSARAA